MGLGPCPWRPPARPLMDAPFAFELCNVSFSPANLRSWPLLRRSLAGPAGARDVADDGPEGVFGVDGLAMPIRGPVGVDAFCGAISRI